MSRHNRTGSGADQRGFHYQISYPPDWLDRIRVRRRLASGRQSTRTLFRNPRRDPGTDPGDRIRIGIRSDEQNLHIEGMVRVDSTCVSEIVLQWREPRSGPDGQDGESISFILTAFAMHPRIPAR